MWRGEVTEAARLYPAGPLLFAGTIAAAVYGLMLAAAGQTLLLRVTRRYELGAVVAGVVALCLNWSLKLVWLGN
jgi:hypothetical protein